MQKIVNSNYLEMPVSSQKMGPPNLAVPFLFFYAMHEVTPIVVAIAVSMLISNCSAHFHVSRLIIHLLPG